ncbi:type I restriction enzyme HsdR N-terminal domain-containing protein [Marinoscillum sp. MHG1-6]|uniref:type I restriction enzyme HsdR N-terminal domain-containing protein n=1 Tax=Marinoscillum sp. MHG1-6 TaxID=2959627 RepID=UPI0021589018|nr:type I restriction enzyme HsdR N-terminal domain-containing protein [Marinoscillum sp. MHG1-6]
MQALNLPPFNIKTKSEEGNEYVFDIVRKKYVILTPEEWVRQHFIHLMINHLGYPKSLIKLEFPLSYFKSGKRSDIILLDREMNPFLLVECKSADVNIDQKTLNQISTYNKVVKAQYIAVTNGLKHFIWKMENGEYTQQTKFPNFPNQL